MFKLPKEIIDEIEEYGYALEKFEEGEISYSRFKGISVPWGIYSHRGERGYMTRIRIPAGVVTPSQLKALAEASCRFGDGILHITTRQDIQIHNVKIEDTIKVIDYLKNFNLSPRGGGGNTVRNITACPFSGICKEEIFDVRGYAIALTEYLLKDESSFNLPRKFKISFSGCEEDCAGCLVNDVGLLAQIKDGKKGFKVFVGGGLGAESRIGKVLEEFLPAQELGYAIQTIKNIFYRRGDRHNRHRNRLRFLIEDIGIEEFKKLYRDEFRRLKEEEYIVLRKIDLQEREEIDEEIPNGEEEDYKEFLKYNVYSQKQTGFAFVELRIPRGDISAEKIHALADLEQEFEGIEFRTSQNQNLIIAWVRKKDIYKLFSRLKTILTDFLYPRTLLDITVCKGALTCNLGLCNSVGLAKELEKVAEEFIGKKVFNKLDIKINGCPNACGQHPIGKIAFYGSVRRVYGRSVPFYVFLLGGRREGELTRLAKEVGIIPAKNVSLFLKSFLEKVEEEIKEDEDIYEFLDNRGKKIYELLGEYGYVPPYEENRNFYIDWGREEEFSLAGIGPGECGAGVLDMIEADLYDAKIALEEAEKEDYSPQKIKKALLFSARSLLVVKGVDPKGEEEVFEAFKEKFIKEKITEEKYINVKKIFENIKEETPLEERKEKFSYAKEFFEHIKELYKNMDSNFNFPTRKSEESEDQKGEIHILDLKGTPCPINYVKAKLF